MLDHISSFCLSHFLCEFDPKSKKRKTRDVVQEIALRAFSADKVSEFLDLSLSHFQKMLVEEFNARYSDSLPLRFQISDSAGLGTQVEGYRPRRRIKEINFQNALHGIPASQFEKLAAIVLKVLGCKNVFFTPASHDQGVDAFGYQDIVSPTPYGTIHHLTWIDRPEFLYQFE